MFFYLTPMWELITHKFCTSTLIACNDLAVLSEPCHAQPTTKQSTHQVPCKGTGIFQKKGIVGFEIRIVHAPLPQFWGVRILMFAIYIIKSQFYDFFFRASNENKVG